MSKSVSVKIGDTFELGTNATKHTHLQIDRAIDSLDRIGHSKREDVQNVRAEFNARGETMDAHAKGQNTGIYSYEDRDKVRGNGYIFGDYCRANYGGAAKDLSNITGDMVKSFLGDLAKLHYAENTFKGYTTAIQKLGAAFGVGDTWNKAIKEFNQSPERSGIVKKDIDHRAYDGNASKVIDCITNEKAKLAAEVIQETGIRRNEACHFSLNGSEIVCNGKNGKEIIKEVSDNLKQKIEALTGGSGRFDMSKHTLSHVWNRACKAAGVDCNGLHGMRHDKAQADMKDTISKGGSVSEGLKAASEDLAHHREGITWTYQR